MREKDELIDQILELELAMFLSVSAREPVSCQQDPEGFRMTRAAQFSVWSEQALASYRLDLEQAAAQGRNLMTLKYARMEGLIPKLHDDTLVENLIDRIVALQVEWQKVMIARYPYLMRRGRPLEDGDEGLLTTSFVDYLRGELETYSEDTLAHLYRDMTDSRHAGRNWTEAIYLHMVKSHGYGSIEEAEAGAKRQAEGM
jgi:hypothetical protein